MKKLAALLLVLVMCFTLCACGGTNDNSELKVGFIFLHDENSTYDLNFINAAKAACEALGVTSVMKTNIPRGSGMLQHRRRSGGRWLLHHLRRLLRP